MLDYTLAGHKIYEKKENDNKIQLYRLNFQETQLLFEQYEKAYRIQFLPKKIARLFTIDSQTQNSRIHCELIIKKILSQREFYFIGEKKSRTYYEIDLFGFEADTPITILRVTLPFVSEEITFHNFKIGYRYNIKDALLVGFQNYLAVVIDNYCEISDGKDLDDLIASQNLQVNLGATDGCDITEKQEQDDKQEVQASYKIFNQFEEVRQIEIQTDQKSILRGDKIEDQIDQNRGCLLFKALVWRIPDQVLLSHANCKQNTIVEYEAVNSHLVLEPIPDLVVIVKEVLQSTIKSQQFKQKQQQQQEYNQEKEALNLINQNKVTTQKTSTTILKVSSCYDGSECILYLKPCKDQNEADYRVHQMDVIYLHKAHRRISAKIQIYLQCEVSNTKILGRMNDRIQTIPYFPARKTKLCQLYYSKRLFRCNIQVTGMITKVERVIIEEGIRRKKSHQSSQILNVPASQNSEEYYNSQQKSQNSSQHKQQLDKCQLSIGISVECMFDDGSGVAKFKLRNLDVIKVFNLSKEDIKSLEFQVKGKRQTLMTYKSDLFRKLFTGSARYFIVTGRPMFKHIRSNDPHQYDSNVGISRPRQLIKTAIKGLVFVNGITKNYLSFKPAQDKVQGKCQIFGEDGELNIGKTQDMVVRLNYVYLKVFNISRDIETNFNDLQ